MKPQYVPASGVVAQPVEEEVVLVAPLDKLVVAVMVPLVLPLLVVKEEKKEEVEETTVVGTATTGVWTVLDVEVALEVVELLVVVEELGALIPKSASS